MVIFQGQLRLLVLLLLGQCITTLQHLQTDVLWFTVEI